jgi:hypothetical protein
LEKEKGETTFHFPSSPFQTFASHSSSRHFIVDYKKICLLVSWLYFSRVQKLCCNPMDSDRESLLEYLG